MRTVRSFARLIITNQDNDWDKRENNVTNELSPLGQIQDSIVAS